MATYKELKARAEGLCAAAGREFDPHGKSKSDLEVLIAELEPAPAEAEQPEEAPPAFPRSAFGTPSPTHRGVEEDNGGPPPPVPSPPPERDPRAPSAEYYVAPGRAVTTQRGQLKEYTPITAKDFFRDGEAVLAMLAKKGAVVRR